MTIEFHCPHCQKLLRTGDDKAGVQANCPGCGQLVMVPAPEAGTSTLPVVGGSSPTGAEQTCPMCGAVNGVAEARCRVCGEALADRVSGTTIHPTILDVGNVLTRISQMTSRTLACDLR